MVEGAEFRCLQKAFESNQVFASIAPRDLFAQWLEAVWAFLSAVEDPDGFRSTLDRYSAAEGGEFARIMGLYVDAVEKHPFEDILGPLFMLLDAQSARAGQFFTPWSVALMMAKMQYTREFYEQAVRDHGHVSVCDPACGSGVMLLAFASVVADDLGRAGLGPLKLYGMDIDLRCVRMAKIQLRFNGLDGFGRTAAALAGLPEPSHDVPAQTLRPEQLELFP